MSSLNLFKDRKVFKVRSTSIVLEVGKTGKFPANFLRKLGSENLISSAVLYTNWR